MREIAAATLEVREFFVLAWPQEMYVGCVNLLVFARWWISDIESMREKLMSNLPLQPLGEGGVDLQLSNHRVDWPTFFRVIPNVISCARLTNVLCSVDLKSTGAAHGFAQFLYVLIAIRNEFTGRMHYYLMMPLTILAVDGGNDGRN